MGKIQDCRRILRVHIHTWLLCVVTFTDGGLIVYNLGTCHVTCVCIIMLYRTNIMRCFITTIVIVIVWDGST